MQFIVVIPLDDSIFGIDSEDQDFGGGHLFCLKNVVFVLDIHIIVDKDSFAGGIKSNV